jgi:hypothetical protein
MTPPVEMTKERAALPATVVAEQTLFIPLGGSTPLSRRSLHCASPRSGMCGVQTGE